MAEYSRAEAANRAGVDPGYVDRLVELGIIAPDASDRLTKGDVRRAQMAQTLEKAGIALEDMATGIRDGSLSLAFMDAPAYDRFATLSNETFEGLSERTGLPLDLLMLIREATGAGVPDPNDRVREDELAVVPVIEAGLAIGFRPVSLARRLRVLGDAMRRVAETGQDAFRSDLTEPMSAAGAEHGGRPVKWLGDGVMVYFPDPAPAALAALDMVDGVVSSGLPPAHVGLHAGPVLSQAGDYFGETVNLAARIAEYARPGEVLVTQQVVDASAEGGATFTQIGPVELKGISGAVPLYAAHRA